MNGTLPKKGLEVGILHPESSRPRVIDAEALLKHTFEVDPRHGCALLFRLYYAPLCSHVIRFVYSREVAEDIVAEVFCKFWDGRFFQKINTSYRAYLFKCARHSAYDFIKHELTKDSQRGQHGTENRASDPCEILQYDELYHRLEETINRLPQKCKKVFVLSRMENKRYQDIASELKISVKAVEAHISKALHVLRKQVNQDWN